MMVIMNCWWLLIIVDGYCWSLICNNRRLSLFWGKPPKGTRQGFFSIGLTLQADQRQLSFWYLAGQIRRGKDPPFHACNLCCLHSASVVTAEALAFEKPWPLKCHLFKKRVKWGILAYPQNIPKWQSSSTHRFLVTSCNFADSFPCLLEHLGIMVAWTASNQTLREIHIVAATLC